MRKFTRETPTGTKETEGSPKKDKITLGRAIAEELFRKRGIVLISMILGFAACILHATCLPEFQIVAFLSFLGPLGLGAYGIRTYRATKEDSYVDENSRLPEKIDPLI